MQLTAILLLLACASDESTPEAREPETAPAAPEPQAKPLDPETLPGRLSWIREIEAHDHHDHGDAPGHAGHHHGGVPRAWSRQGDLAGTLDGATFPAAPDPLGTHDLIVRSTEDPHLESLWLVPRAGEGAETPVQLGFSAQMVRNPAWSPDGRFVVFESNHQSFRDLYRVERTGGEVQRLTTHKNGSFEPRVGPHGRIAFVSSQTGDAEIWTMGADGGDPVQVTERPGDDTQPGWMGDDLVWLARTGMMVELWRQRGSTPEPFRKTSRDRPPGEAPPRQLARQWAASPDGQRMAISVQTGPAEVQLQILDADGGVLKTIDGPQADENPAWSPDSQWLVFTAHLDGQKTPDLYVVDRDGEAWTRVTTDDAANWLPRWGR